MTRSTLWTAILGLAIATAMSIVPSGIGGRAWAQAPEDAALESDHAFRQFIETLWPEVRAAGVSRRTFERALAEIRVDWSVLERANFQPEHEFSIGDYLGKLASPARVEAGRALIEKHANLMAEIEAAFGVDRHIVAAIWGIESNFGAGMGEHGVVRALGMLAWKGERRATFGRQQLIAALQIIERGDVAAADMTGSWAGAMGHTQFIPTTYSRHAVDFDKDGRRDIWTGVADALASTANYLKVSGWRAGVPWGFEVRLPAGFDYALMDRELPMAEWAHRGVERPQGTVGTATGPVRANLPVASPSWSGIAATLRLPAGAKGPAFLVTGNFKAILKYNNATSYALAVGHLGDRLAGAGHLAQTWPADDRPLRRREREELQGLLLALGDYRGEIDGLLGDQTKAALIAWQRRAGVVPDGYASARLLGQMRARSGMMPGGADARADLEP